MAKTYFKVNSVIVCDDIRNEDNGKSIIIGTYNGGIVLSKIPSNLQLCFWFMGNSSSDNHELQFKIGVVGADKKDSVATEQKMVLEYNPDLKAPIEDTEFVLALLKVPLVMKGKGEFYVKMKHQKDKSWKKLVSKNVTLAPDATALQPPS